MAQERPIGAIGETCRESTRVAVETAVDLARGVKRGKWSEHRAIMRDKIALWEENIPPPEGLASITLSSSQPGEPTTDALFPRSRKDNVDT